MIEPFKAASNVYLVLRLQAAAPAAAAAR